MILGEPGTLVPGSKIQREREAIAELSLFSFADFVRDPERFSVASEVISGSLFRWQAGTPAVDEDVDPPKRKRLAVLLEIFS